MPNWLTCVYDICILFANIYKPFKQNKHVKIAFWGALSVLEAQSITSEIYLRILADLIVRNK